MLSFVYKQKMYVFDEALEQWLISARVYHLPPAAAPATASPPAILMLPVSWFARISFPSRSNCSMFS
jgi:hypothetical protein